MTFGNFLKNIIIIIINFINIKYDLNIIINYLYIFLFILYNWINFLYINIILRLKKLF